VADANGNALLVGSHTATGAQYVDIARLTATGAPDATFSSGRFASVETHGGPVGAAELADGRVVVWTAGGELVAFASDGSVPKVQSLAVLGTVLTATLDSAQRLVVAGMMTANPVDSEWFVRRYLLL
ncbi:MAG TPA: hypothetical protein VGY54_23445, partial [Polyangiaceae bacterium]|nr:hypothetical protein [Polyangiaceae bacterium]